MEIKIATQTEFNLFLKTKIIFNKEYSISDKDSDFIKKEFDDYLDNGTVILAIENDNVLGYLCGLIEKNEYEKVGYIGEVFVLKEFRNQGISTKLKDKFIEFLKSKKIDVCRIDVNPTNSAKDVYEKWGFKIDKYRMSIKF